MTWCPRLVAVTPRPAPSRRTGVVAARDDVLHDTVAGVEGACALHADDHLELRLELALQATEHRLRAAVVRAVQDLRRHAQLQRALRAWNDGGVC